MESVTQCPWWTTRPQGKLLGYLHPSHCLGLNSLLLHPCYHATLENAPDRLYHGIFSSSFQTPLYMNIPKGYKVPKDGNNQPLVLWLLRNIYGQTQGPKVWGDCPHKALVKAKRQVDTCLYYRHNLSFLLCMDDCLLFESI